MGNLGNHILILRGIRLLRTPYKCKERMGCNSSKATGTGPTDMAVEDTQAVGEVDSRPVFYAWGFSPFVRAVAMVAVELEVDLVIKEIDLLKSEHKTPEYEAINPNKTVPALTHGETKIGESRTIAVYLANT